MEEPEAREGEGDRAGIAGAPAVGDAPAVAPRAQRRGPPSWRLSRRLFLFLCAASYLCAFGSLLVQLRGLIGSEGIRPAAQLLDWARTARPDEPYWHLLRFPTVFWLASGDAALVGACGLGVVLALVAMAGLLQRIVFPLLWILYLSFAAVGDAFLGFQWDVLLIEAGLLAVLYAPPGLVRARWVDPPALVRRLITWLLFRVTFMSGVVKLLSRDEAWADLTALDYHYWTQPLPHAWSHYVHHALASWHSTCVVLMFVLELVVPPLLFFPRHFRNAAAVLLALLMAGFFATGSYGFFQLLVFALCVGSMDDRLLRAIPGLRGGSGGSEGDSPCPRWRRALLAAFALAVLAWTSLSMARRFGLVEDVPAPLEALDRTLRPFRAFNTYGLFAVMTTERPEIQIEGSADGRTWQPYVFRYKPGDLDRRPRAAFFHMPRLDWQMWFAALGPWQRSDWYGSLVGRLLAGSSDVGELFEHNPFPDEPPRLVRSRLFRYTFSSPEERAVGRWWKRSAAGHFCPTFKLQGGRLEAVGPGR